MTKPLCSFHLATPALDKDHLMHTKTLLYTTIISVLSCQARASELPSPRSISDDVTILSDKDTMTLYSDKKNNVIKWNTFNVSEDAKMFYDENNYLNLVTGGERSRIDGKIFGSGNLYIVNPAGITTGVNSLIRAEKLGLVTAAVSDSAIEDFESSGALNIVDSDGIGRVNLLGTIKTGSLCVEGGQIVIRDISNIKEKSGDKLTNSDNENIKLSSSVHRIDIGGPSDLNLKDDYGFSSSDYVAHAGQTPISTRDEFLSIKADGDYFITNDISLGTITSPLASSKEFTGTIDGTFSAVDFTLEHSSTDIGERSGLFAITSNARFKNLRLEGAVKSSGGFGSAAGVLTGEMRGGTLESVEIRNSSVSVNPDSESSSLGGIAGIMSGTVLMDNSSAVLDSSFRDLISNESIEAGAIVGRLDGTITARGLSFGLLSNGEALSAVGTNNGKSGLSSSMSEAYSSLPADDKTNFFDNDGVFDDRSFSDIYTVKNLSLENDPGVPDYASMISAKSLDPSAWFSISLNSSKSGNGVYAFDLKSKRAAGRSLVFMNTSKDGGVTYSKTGLGQVFIPASAVEETPSDPTEPSTPSEPTDPSGAGASDTPSLPEDPDAKSNENGTDLPDASGSDQPKDPDSSDENKAPVSDSETGADPDGAGSEIVIDLNKVKLSEREIDGWPELLLPSVKYSLYPKRVERAYTMRLRVPSLPSDLLASARESTRRALDNLLPQMLASKSDNSEKKSKSPA